MGEPAGDDWPLLSTPEWINGAIRLLNVSARREQLAMVIEAAKLVPSSVLKCQVWIPDQVRSGG